MSRRVRDEHSVQSPYSRTTSWETLDKKASSELYGRSTEDR